MEKLPVMSDIHANYPALKAIQSRFGLTHSIGSSTFDRKGPQIVNGVHFLNPGSVGRPFDGDPRTSFAILTIHSGEISVEHIRIPYLVGEMMESLEKNGLPDIYAKMCRAGIKLN